MAILDYEGLEYYNGKIKDYVTTETEKYLPLTGGNVTGATTLGSTLRVTDYIYTSKYLSASENIYAGNDTRDANTICAVRNKYRYGGIYVSTTSELGLRDLTNNRYIIYQDVDGITRIPASLVCSSSITASNIELSAETPFIDFHFGKSTDDYTSRILENSSGHLILYAPNGIKTSAGLEVGANLNVTDEAILDSTLDVTGVATLKNRVDVGATNSTLQLKSSTYNSFLYNNGTATYFLISDSGTANSWNSLRPFQIEHSTGKVTIKTGLELASSKPFIDFHFGDSTDDYTSRIIENSSGHLNIIAANGVTTNAKLEVGGSVYLPNATYVQAKNSSGTYKQLLGINSSNMAIVGGGLSIVQIGISGTTNTVNIMGNTSVSGDFGVTGNSKLEGLLTFHTSTYSSRFYNNGTTTYLLLTDSGSNESNSLRPFSVNNTTGYITALKGFATHIVPDATDTRSLGSSTSLRFNNIYAKTSTIASSDENAKKDIVKINDKYEQLFDKLTPVSYKFKDGERTHLGYISQKVQDAMNEVELTDMDFAGFCRDKVQEEKIIQEAIYDENGNMLEDVVTEMVDVLDEDGNVQYTYGLRYEEFIALNTDQIQKLKTRVNTLEEENAELKATLENVLERLVALENK